MDSTSGIEAFLGVLPALALVAGAPLAIWWWSKRSRSSSTHRLRITDKAALGKNTWVAVIEVDDRRLLVGAGEGGVNKLTELELLPATDDGQEDASSAIGTTNGIIEQPRNGLVRRLQQMTLRTSLPPERPFDATRR